jgi:hypothetical protein
MEQLTLETVVLLVEQVLREEFRHGITMISSLGILQRLQDDNDLPQDCPHIYDAIQVMVRRKYLQSAHPPRGSPLWYARVTEGEYYDIRAASRINDNWVPTWFDLYLEKLTEAREKSGR